MTSTLTIRLPKEQRAALRKRAISLRKSESELVRALIDRDLSSAMMLERVADLVGSLDSNISRRPAHPLKKKIRERNWRSR